MDWLILTLSLVAGVVGTGLGGVIGVLLKNRGARVMGRVLGFAGGVMAGVVAFEMIPEAIESTVIIGKAGGIATAVATTVGGMAVVFAVNKLLDFIERKKNTYGGNVLENKKLGGNKKCGVNAKRGVNVKCSGNTKQSGNAKRGGNANRKNDIFRTSALTLAHAHRGYTNDIAQTAVLNVKSTLNVQNNIINRGNCKIYVSTVNEEQSVKTNIQVGQAEKTNVRRRELIKAGTVMLIAIALHNFPEGMAIGASGSLEMQMGILIALIIAVHNIPEGMAISAPLVSGGVHGAKAILLTALAGGATVVGAVFGLAVGGLGELATGICLSLASGAMLYVTFCDIIPQSISLCNGDVPSISMLAGLVFSIIFVFAF